MKIVHYSLIAAGLAIGISACSVKTEETHSCWGVGCPSADSTVHREFKIKNVTDTRACSGPARNSSLIGDWYQDWADENGGVAADHYTFHVSANETLVSVHSVAPNGVKADLDIPVKTTFDEFNLKVLEPAFGERYASDESGTKTYHFKKSYAPSTVAYELVGNCVKFSSGGEIVYWVR